MSKEDIVGHFTNLRGSPLTSKSDSALKRETVSSPPPVMDQWLEMFALFAHDLETPLASMKYVLRLIDAGNLDVANARHRQIVASTRIAVDRAESVLYDIMAVAKAGELGLTSTLELLELGPIVQEVVAMASVVGADHQVSVAVVDPLPRGRVIADSHLLRRALDNLLFNAIRHTPEGKSVTVTVEQKERALCVNIKDSGCGLGEIDPEELFEKYGQISLRGQGKHRGVGLGLYFCRLAANAMGGHVSATNHTAGGAVFTLCLRQSGEE